MSIEIITLVLFGALLLFLLMGLPIGFVLGGVAVVFTFFLWGPQALNMLPLKTFAGMYSFILTCIPMFVFMGIMLEKSGLAEDLYKMMYTWLGTIKGGLAMGTVLICTLFAAMSGISGVATVSMGLIALPSMLKRKYDKRIAVGCIAAGGALGILIPPSVIMVLFALFSGVSIGKLFIGGILPGLLLSSLFNIYIAIRCTLQPHLGPSIPAEEKPHWGERVASLKAVVLPLLLVVAVLGTIFTGIATPTEASAIGALGSVLCAIIYRRFTWNIFKETCYKTLTLTVMMMWIFFGAMAFASVYTALGAPDLIKKILMAVPGGRWGPIIAIQLTFFVLGCFLDQAGIIMITLPIYLPIVKALGFDPVWFGILFTVNMEMSYLTPPFGYNLFYLKSIVPKSITMAAIYRSIIPFVCLQALGLILVMVFPQIVMVLPNLVFPK